MRRWFWNTLGSVATGEVESVEEKLEKATSQENGNEKQENTFWYLFGNQTATWPWKIRTTLYIHTYITLHNITLHYITLHYITLHYIHTYIYIYMYVYIHIYDYLCIYIYVGNSLENPKMQEHHLQMGDIMRGCTTFRGVSRPGQGRGKGSSPPCSWGSLKQCLIWALQITQR